MFWEFLIAQNVNSKSNLLFNWIFVIFPNLLMARWFKMYIHRLWLDHFWEVRPLHNQVVKEQTVRGQLKLNYQTMSNGYLCNRFSINTMKYAQMFRLWIVSNQMINFEVVSLLVIHNTSYNKSKERFQVIPNSLISRTIKN